MLKTLDYTTGMPVFALDQTDVTPRDVMNSNCAVLVNAKTQAWLAEHDSRLCFYGRANGVRIGERPYGGEAA